MKTRTGKIARLPKPIREQLNQRLENGEPGNSVVTWLNQLPEVQKIITEQFAGLPIRPQNLSEWRKGGYLDWTRHQLLREQTRWTAEQADDLGLDTTGKSISIAEDIATVLSAQLAIHVHALGDIKNPHQRFRQFCRLSRELSRLRQDDQRAIRNQLRHKQPQRPRQPTVQAPPSPEPSVERDSACPSQLQRSRVEPKLPPPPQPDSNASTPRDCGSPLPLTLSETHPEHPIPTPDPASNICPPSAGGVSSPSPKDLATAETPKLSNPQTLPALSAPIRVNPSRNYYDPRPPLRGRRFVCIEG